MKYATILIVFLSHQGHWLAGHQASVSVQHDRASARRPMIFSWGLGYDDARVASGRISVERGKSGTVQITVPNVRVRTPMQLVYRVQLADGGTLLEEGEKAIVVYPDDLLAGLDKRLKDRRLVVWDRADRIPALLSKAGVDHLQIDDESQLALRRPDIILVGPDEMEDRPFGQDYLIGQARAGAGIFLFAQTRVTKLVDHPLGARESHADLVWQSKHPLVEHIRHRDLDSRKTPPRPLRVTPDDATQRVAFWPRADSDAQTVNSLVTVEKMGKGRMVFCQLDLGDLQSDPRNQLFLADVLTYLSTKPELD